MDYKLKRLNRELASPGKALEFYRDTMELPDGRTEKWDFVHHRTRWNCLTEERKSGISCTIKRAAEPVWCRCCPTDASS